MERYRDKSIDRESLKTLVIAFGPREAARQSGINVNTVLSLARRKKWKRTTTEEGNSQSVISNPLEVIPDTDSTPTQTQSICTLSPSNALAESLRRLKERSTIGISEYVAKAADELSRSPNPLMITGKAKDIADVHRTMWPHENSRNDILQIGILIAPAESVSTPRDSLGQTQVPKNS